MELPHVETARTASEPAPHAEAAPAETPPAAAGRFGRRLPRLIAATGFVLLVGAGLLALIHHQVCAGASDRIHATDTAPPRYVAIVFGARVYPDGSVCAPLAGRLQTALDLYRSGRVRKIMVSGDNRFDHYNEPEVMRDWLLARGVAAQDVFCDYGGRRTLDTCARASRLWNIDEAILVTQAYHLPRALFLAGAWHIDAVGVPAGGFVSRRDTLREILARVLAWLDIHLLHTDPELWGPPERIPT